VGKPSKQGLRRLQPLASPCLFVFLIMDSSKASRVTSHRDFLGGGCRSTTLWGFQDVPYVLKNTAGGRTLGLSKPFAVVWLYLAQIKKSTSPMARSPATYRLLCHLDLIFTAHRPLYGQKKQEWGGMAPYLTNNLAQKTSVSHLRPNLAFPQRARSL